MCAENNNLHNYVVLCLKSTLLHTVELKIEMQTKRHAITIVENFKSIALYRHKTLLTTVQNPAISLV